MNENTRTLTFVGIALLAGVLAYAAIPRPVEDDAATADVRDTLLFEAFSPEDAAQISIVKYEAKNLDEMTLLSEGKFKPTTLEIKKDGEDWVVASHDNYPIDAEDKVADAAGVLMRLRIDGVVSQDASDHEEYGVVEPDQERFDVMARGVGTLVRLADTNGESLVNLIIGDEVETDRAVQPGEEPSNKRYVRRAGDDAVYIVRVDPKELSTKFKDWIVDDLLKITESEIAELSLYDYVVATQVDALGRRQEKPMRLSEMTFAKDGSDWKATLIKKLDEKTGKHAERKMEENEALDTSALGDIRKALGELKIVGVSSKPKPLADALRQGLPFGNDRESVIALRDNGFLPEVRDGKVNVVGEQGEVVIGLDTGVEYVIRFGQTAGLEEKGDRDKKDGKDEGGEKSDDAAEVGLNRYCYVTARYNQDLIPKPEYEELPKLEDFLPKKEGSEQEEKPEPETESQGEKQEKEENQKEDAAKKDGDNDKGAEAADESNAGADEEKAADSAQGSVEEKAKAPTEDGATRPTTGNTTLLTQAEDAAESEDTAEGASEEVADRSGDVEDQAAATSDEPSQQVEPKADVAKDEADKSKKQDGESDGAKTEEPKKKTPEEEAKEKFEKELARVKAENEKKRMEYEEKLGKAREKVEQINARFADWFYVIADTEYKKIHKTSDELIKDKDSAADTGNLPPGHPPAGDFKIPGLPKIP